MLARPRFPPTWTAHLAAAALTLLLVSLSQVTLAWQTLDGRAHSREWILDRAAAGRITLELFRRGPELPESGVRLLRQSEAPRTTLPSLTIAGLLSLLALAWALLLGTGGAVVEWAVSSRDGPRRWLLRVAVTGTPAAAAAAACAPAGRGVTHAASTLALTALAWLLASERHPGATSLRRGLLVAGLALAAALPHQLRRGLPVGARGASTSTATRLTEHPDAPPASHRPTPTWAPAPAPDRPTPKHVILIAVDTLRPDHLSVYGYGRKTSPRLEEVMEAEGIVFERAYVSAPWTLPSTASLFTSLHPPQHGVEEGDQRLHPDVPTLAGAFAAQGWHSAAFVTHIYVSSRFGLDSGFHEFWELSIDWGFGEGRQLRAGSLTEQAGRWLEERKDDRFFLYLHYFDPHWDYEPPTPWDEAYTDPSYQGPGDGSWSYMSRFVPIHEQIPEDDLAQCVALYDGEVGYTDAELGRLFDRLRELGMWDDTLIVLVSDHGEEFQEHGSVGHQRTVFEELVRVPLLMKPAGGRSEGMRTRVPERVRTLDVAPTVLAAAGLQRPPGFEGLPLQPLLLAPGPDRDAYARTRRRGLDRTALLVGRHKLIHDAGTRGRDLLFDLAADPDERRSLAREEADRLREMLDRLLAWEASMQETGAATPKDEARVDLSESEEEHLRSLGYVQ